MKSTLNISTELFWYLGAVILIPTGLLAAAGLYYVWTTHQLTAFLLLWLLGTITLAGIQAIRARMSAHRQSKTQSLPRLPRLVARDEWSPQDVQAWSAIQLFIDQKLSADPPWDELKDIALEQHSKLAEIYFPEQPYGTLSFTLPELLVVLEVTSRRYRTFIKNNIPFAESVTIATFKTVYGHRSKVEKGYRMFDLSRRLFRLANPLTAVVGEVRDHISGRLLNQTGAKMQFELKRTLLEELAQVAIDLYSGRLRVTDAELSTYVSDSANQDSQRVAQPVEQLRILVLGQTNVGKSSLINALTGTRSAEYDLLPSTSELSTHHLAINDNLSANLIDTPGIDGTLENKELLLDEASHADLLIWVCKATQPGRILDRNLLDSIRHYFELHTSRVPIPVITVVTHIDRLRPINEWVPPYNSDNPGSEKYRNIQAVISVVRNTLKLTAADSVIPISTNPTHAPYNIELLVDQLNLFSGIAANVQLNRRRIELGDKKSPWKHRLRQSRNLVNVVVGNRLGWVRNRLSGRSKDP